MSDIRSISYQGGTSVTQSDTTADPNGPFAAIEATSASGSVKITTVDGSVMTVYLAQGLIKPIEVTRVWSTGTTATGIVGYYAVAKVL
jgi:hypothetical protein